VAKLRCEGDLLAACAGCCLGRRWVLLRRPLGGGSSSGRPWMLGRTEEGSGRGRAGRVGPSLTGEDMKRGGSDRCRAHIEARSAASPRPPSSRPSLDALRSCAGWHSRQSLASPGPGGCGAARGRRGKASRSLPWGRSGRLINVRSNKFEG